MSLRATTVRSSSDHGRAPTYPPATTIAPRMTTTRGLVALGDSITNGHGEPALGVHPQSWAQWLAEALELPFTKLAVDGAQAADVLRDQVPRLRGPYDLACVTPASTTSARSTSTPRPTSATYARSRPRRARRPTGWRSARSRRTSGARGPRPSRRRERDRPPGRRRARRDRRRPRRPRGLAVAAARRRPPHRARPARDRRPGGAGARGAAAARRQTSRSTLAPRPRALRGAPRGAARRRPAPAGAGADHARRLRG